MLGHLLRYFFRKIDSHCNEVVKAGAIAWFPRRMPGIRGELNAHGLFDGAFA